MHVKLALASRLAEFLSKLWHLRTISHIVSFGFRNGIWQAKCKRENVVILVWQLLILLLARRMHNCQANSAQDWHKIYINYNSLHLHNNLFAVFVYGIFPRFLYKSRWNAYVTNLMLDDDEHEFCTQYSSISEPTMILLPLKIFETFSAHFSRIW